jgi:hypothetical protein
MNWISVEDKLPENDRQVFLCAKYHYGFGDVFREGQYLKLGFYSVRRGWVYKSVYRNDEVTHWMELPEKPK